MSEAPVRSRKGEDGRRRDLSRPPAPEPLPVPVPDSHCHLDIADGEPADGQPGEGAAGQGEDGRWDVSRAVRAAAEVGVTRIVQIGCEPDTLAWSVDVAERHPSVVAGIAVHPNEAPVLEAQGRLAEVLAEVERLAAGSERVRAIGETGLDFFRTGPEGRGVQEEAFREHIRIAKRLDRALVIHDRDSHDDVLRVLEDEGAPERTVFHCFSGDVDMARHCVERGYVLSFAGTITFKNADGLREALAACPVDQVLVETDAPYLTPTPYRGRPNASYLVPLTLRRMAEVLGTDVADLAATVTATTERIFGAWASASPTSGR